MSLSRSVKIFSRLKQATSLLIITAESNQTLYLLPHLCKLFTTGKPAEHQEPLLLPKKSFARFPAELLPRQSLLEDTEQPKLRAKTTKSIKYTLVAMGVTVVFIGAYAILQLGKPQVGTDGKVIVDEFSNMPLPVQYFHRTLQEIRYYTKLIQEPSREKLLPDELRFPYFQPAYTLVLELTDVLVHPDWTYLTGWRFKKRPGIDHFLETLSGSYEIVVYTAEQGLTVFPIVEALDPKNYISYKLVRDATHFIDGHHVKNLDKLNRDLKKVIVVDWNPESIKFHPENVFHISRWTGSDDDATLIDLTAFLMTIANSGVEDVRDVLSYYNTFDDGLRAFRRNQRILLEQQEAKIQEKSETPLPNRKWPTSLINKPTALQ